MGQSQKLGLKSPRAVPGSISSHDRELARLARALGHPARVAILRRLLAQGDCVCGRIVDLLPLAQATVSQHLKVLREAGWIEGETRGTTICYRAVPGALGRFEALWSRLPIKKGATR